MRKQTILNTLQQAPLTTEELAHRLDMNYHTVYKSCRELQEDGLIHYTGQVRGKSYVWATGTNAGMPEFFDPAGNRKIRADDIVTAYSVNRDAASVRAAKMFFETLEQLLNIASEIADGSSNVTEADLKKIRNETIVNHSFVKNLSGYYQQLLANNNFWSVDTLGLIGAHVQKSAAAD